MLTMPRLVLSLACVAGVASCSLFTDLSGISGDGAPVDDGGADLSDVAEVATPEGGTVDALGSGADAGFACATLDPKPTFCDDFDTNPLGYDWQMHVSSGAELSFDLTRFRSSPRALLARSGSGQTRRDAYLLREANTVSTHVRVAFDALVDDLESERVVVSKLFFADSADATGPARQLWLYFEARSATILESSATGDAYHELTRYPLAGSWARYEVDLALDTRTITVTMDGVVAAQKTLSSAFKPAFVSYALGAMRMGNPPFGEVRVWIDDVVVDLQ